MRANVYLLEHECLTRESITILVNNLDCYQVVGASGRISQAETEINQLKPDLLIFDLIFPDGEGFDLLERLDLEALNCHCIALSANRDPYILYRLRRSLIRGFVDKQVEGLQQIPQALDTVMKGEAFFSPSIRDSFGDLLADPEAFYKILTPRELTLLPLYGQGWSNREVAKELGISASTVQGHRRNIMRKLKLKSLSELVCYAMTIGVIRPEQLEVNEATPKFKLRSRPGPGPRSDLPSIQSQD